MAPKSRKKDKQKSRVIKAGGGLVWRQSSLGKEIAIIHRPRYDDWTFPKGKLHKGETWEHAALREVEEETKCRASLGNFAGCSCYLYEDCPKVVLYWHMQLLEEGEFIPGEEVDHLEWLPVEAALKKLSYAGERQLLK
jgi:8-oxo-dGTP pyrophosphatase MutT (NUDIX family)